MTTTVLSSKGQVIIPKPIRTARHWEVGERLLVEETPEGVLLRPISVFKPTTPDQLAGSLKWSGSPKSLNEMDEAIAKGVRERMNGCD